MGCRRRPLARPRLLLLLLRCLLLPAAAPAPRATGGAGPLADPASPSAPPAMTPQSPFPGGAEPSASAGQDPRHGSRDRSLPAGPLSNSAEEPAGPKERPGEAVDGAPAVEGRQRWPPTRGGPEAPSGGRAREPPHTPGPPSLPPTVATVRLPPPWASGATSAPLKGPAGEAPSPAPHGGPTAGSAGGAPGGQEPTAPFLLALGSRGAPVGEGSRTGAEPSRTPPPGQGPAWATQGRGSSEDLQGTPPLSARQPPAGPTDPGPSWLPPRSTAISTGSDRGAHTTERGPPPPRTGSTAWPLTEGGLLWQQPGGPTDAEWLAPHLAGGTGTPERPSYPALVLAGSPTPSSASPTRLGPTGEGAGETPLPGAPTLLLQEPRPPWGGSSARERGGEALHTAPASPSSSHAAGRLEEEPASPLVPDGLATPLPLSPDGCSSGQPSREGQAVLPTPAGPPAVVGPAPSPVGALPDSPPTAPGKEGGPWGASRTQAGPGVLPPRPSPHPPLGPSEGAPAATSATWGAAWRGLPTDSVQGPRAGPPAGSTQVPPRQTDLLSKSTAFSGPATQSRGVGGAVGVPSPPSVAPHRPWTSPSRTWSWKGANWPGGATGSQWNNIIPQTPGPSHATVAPLSESLGHTTSTTSTTSRSGAWPPWPPEATTQRGIASRGESPMRATPWLPAAGPGEAPTRPGAAVPREGRPGSHPAFVVENQPPLLKAALLPVACELVLAMEFSSRLRDPHSPEYQSLVRSLNETVAPLFAPLPGFQRLEVTAIRPGSVAVVFQALFLPQAPGVWAALARSPLSERLPPGLRVGNASVLRSVTLERRLDPCTVLFSCRAGYECLAQEDGRALCTSLCHRGFCRNQGICTHAANQTPACQCPVGHDFWFLGVHCDYKVTQQGLLGAACGLLLSLLLLGLAVAGLVARRVRLLLLEARADQTKSSYRRFCRLDDVSAHYWSEPWLASTPSLDNPAFSNSEELLHLQRLSPACFGCQGDSGPPDGRCRPTPDTAGGLGTAGRRMSSRHDWAGSCSSLNDPMGDSGKASEVSVSSWPMEPLQWSPCPALRKLPRDQAPRAPRPSSSCEGLELVTLERSWTA